MRITRIDIDGLVDYECVCDPTPSGDCEHYLAAKEELRDDGK